MLPRCSAAFLLILAFILGIAVADHRSSSVLGEAGSSSKLAATALVNAQVLVSAKVDGQEIRQSSPPAVAQPRSTSSDPGKSLLVEEPSDWRCLTQARFVVADRYVADIPQFRSTTRSATGPPAVAV